MSAAGEIRAVTAGSRDVARMWWRGSLVMAGWACRCAGQGLALGWKAASTDAGAVAEKRSRIRAQRVKAAERGEKSGKASTLPDPEAPIVLEPGFGKRSFLAALGTVVMGGGLALVIVGTGASVLVPMIPDLTVWRPVIFGGGFVAWSAAALMLAPPLTPENDHEKGVAGEQGESDVQEDTEALEQASPVHPGAALLWHVIRDLSDAEFSKRAGVHLDVMLDGAMASGLLPRDTEQTRFREWLAAAGVPTVEKLGMRIDGKPTTRVGARVDDFIAAHGCSPTALLQDLPAAGTQAPVPAPGEAPAGAPVEAPAPARGEAPAAAFLTLIPGGLTAPALAPSRTPSPASLQEGAQEGR
ncbi:hypothetical protein [Streptomyces sp. H27-S2]|uniref:hypothetical protein n=1 Tax=Streptomyces antarcticus TaxID=2996458 RepID=UPI0022716B4B|nr:hypothetical protein [Streptomyces sp. H27-S2]MCY0954140.1 hypothetical protein [Streptomyces sp. H27-S2]